VRRRTFLGLAVALVAGIGAECGEPAPTKRDPNDPNPPEPAAAPKDAQIGQYTVRGAMISVWVEPGRWPVTVKVDAINHATGEHINITGDEHGPGHDLYGPGLWSVPLSYPAGERTEVTITAHALHPSTKGYVAWRDGPRIKRSAGFNGTAGAELHIWTER
jgi:hypothetical protein